MKEKWYIFVYSPRCELTRLLVYFDWIDMIFNRYIIKNVFFVCFFFSMNLYELIKKNNFQGFSIALIRRFAFSLLQCLKLLQRDKIIHCDLKPVSMIERSCFISSWKNTQKYSPFPVAIKNISYQFMKRKWWPTNSTNINKTSNHLSPQITKHKKDHDIWHWKFMSWLGTGTNMWQC